MMADGLMHNPPKERSPFRRVPFALALSLTLLGATGCGREPGVTGTMRVRHGDVWEEFPTQTSVWIAPNAGLSFDLGPVFTFCNSDLPPEEVDRKERRHDARGLCVYVDFESFARESEPAEYAIHGTAQFPAPGYSSHNIHFEPGPGHSPGLKDASTWSFCPEEELEDYAPQQVSGRFVLEENSKHRLRGQLELTVAGTTGGTCAGDAAEVDLDFDIISL